MRPIDADVLVVELQKDEALFDNEAMVARENSIKYTDNYAKIMRSRANGIRDAIIEVYDAPTIDIDRLKGKWIEHKWKEYNEELMMSFPCHNYECSECSFHAYEPTNFCPNCGANMREREGE